MKISDISIKNPVFAWMLMLGLMVFGLIGFSRMGISQMPDADFPVLNVSVSLEGASPEVMESSVVDPIEDAVVAVEGLKGISSSSKTGQANITLEFDLDKNVDIALQEVQTRIAQTSRLLPKETETPVITKSNPEDQPILWLALTYKKDDLQYLMKYARDRLKDRFTTVPGVGEIFLGGYTAPALRVWVKPQELMRRNIAVTDILDAISTEHAELPGGSLDEEKKSYNVRTIGEAKTVEEFGNITVARRAGQMVADPSQMVRLKEVADVEMGLDEIRRISRFNGVTALGLGIRKQRGSNAVEVAKQVKAKIAEIQKELPEGMELHINFDSTRFIENSVHELNKHLVFAAILTSLVCWIFLGSLSATFNVLLSIPTSILGAFIGMYFLNFTLNTFTLLGLTLAIGIVVDDAIMVLENIFRYQEMKYGRIKSAILGSREIAFAAMAATVAVIAIFLPVAFMKGVIGKYFLQFGVTISFAVLLSLLESLTITPMRASAFVSTEERKSKIGLKFDSWMTRLEEFYARTLEISLRKKKQVMIGSGIFLVLSFGLVKFIPKEMAPVQDMSLFMVRIQTPVGSSISYMDQQTKAAEKWFAEQKEVKQVYASVGGFTGGAGDGNTAMMFITLQPKNQRKMSQEQFMEVTRKNLEKIPDLKVFIQDLSMRGFTASGGFPVEFKITGSNWDELAKINARMIKEMKDSGIMVDVDSNYLLGMPEIQVKPDRIQAALHGVSVKGIGQTINANISGVRAGQFPLDGKRYDIRLQLKKDPTKKPELGNLLIGNARGNLISLSKVVTQDTQPSLQQISRVDRQRAISLFANLKPGSSQAQAMDFITKKAKEILPEGYSLGGQGNLAAMKESFMGLMFALVLGFFVAYMVLAAQFNSFLDPVTILMAMPFSIAGAFFALLITFQSINMFSMIGILLLMGIVKKNSIMLVEFANTVRDRAQKAGKEMSAEQALREACPIRLRPILMTSLATVAGAVPSAIAFGDGSETSRPMAITIIGGVLVSTILTLYVIPAYYLAFDRFRKRDKNLVEIHKAFADVEANHAGH